MKNHAFLFLASALFVFSCKSDEDPSCKTCISTVTPPFDLCKESNGNASVNGENTGVAYGIYLEGLLEEGVECD